MGKQPGRQTEVRRMVTCCQETVSEEGNFFAHLQCDCSSEAPAFVECVSSTAALIIWNNKAAAVCHEYCTCADMGCDVKSGGEKKAEQRPLDMFVLRMNRIKLAEVDGNSEIYED